MKKKSMLDLGRITAEEFKSVDKIPVAVVLDDVRSEMNIGSVFRTADAFVVEQISHSPVRHFRHPTICRDPQNGTGCGRQCGLGALPHSDAGY